MYACVVMPVFLIVLQYKQHGYVLYDYYPLGFFLVQVLFRIFIISIRHGTTPPRVYRDMYTQPITAENLNEGLIFRAWALINE